MIISKCPLRVSLVGGSTDIQAYLDKYSRGSVISFPITLCVNIILKERKDNNLRIVYSHTEDVNVEDVGNIKNDVVREVLKEIECPPMDIVFLSDIPSTGSGLASSTAYTIALIKALSIYNGLNLSQYDICTLAHKIERRFNPLVGYQDPYGCGIGSLKKLTFNPKGLENVVFLDGSTLNGMAMYLIPTNVSRSSTKILDTLDIDKIHQMASFADTMEKHILSDYFICRAVNLSWNKKKETSPDILTPEVLKVEEELYSATSVQAMKLCGAGGGGYFFALATHPMPKLDRMGHRIYIDNVGVTAKEVYETPNVQHMPVVQL